MKIVRYPHLNSLFSDFDSLFADHFRAFAPLLRSTLGSSTSAPYSGVEWYENEESYVARVELPGVKKEKLKLELDEGLLRLACERRRSLDAPGSFDRSEQILRVPEDADPDGISASLENGILELNLAKADEAKPVRIEIK
ncbi:MAG: Hsp20/alpha crystallin family protein [Verrucomicrobiales bacterium]